MNILYLINHRPFFVSHRLPIAIKMRQIGHKVNLLTGVSSDKKMENFAKKLKEKKIKCNLLDFNSSGLDFFNLIITFYKIYKFIKKTNPDIVHTASMKTNILSGLSCYILNKPIVIAFSGFGYLFTENKNLKTIFLRKIIETLIKIIFLNKNKHIIVQNKFDFNYLVNGFNLKKKYYFT